MEGEARLRLVERATPDVANAIALGGSWGAVGSASRAGTVAVAAAVASGSTPTERKLAWDRVAGQFIAASTDQMRYTTRAS
jgi:hypothetical protein